MSVLPRKRTRSPSLSSNDGDVALSAAIALGGSMMAVCSMSRLEGQVSWISGAASGIGEGVARLFAEEGARVALIDVQTERGRRVCEEIRAAGGQAEFIHCDVGREEEM